MDDFDECEIGPIVGNLRLRYDSDRSVDETHVFVSFFLFC